MVNYDLFAKFYDTAMNTGSNTSDKVKHLKAWIHKYNPSAKTLLELGCGTGTILKEFVGDFELTGLDLSSEMLAIARQKVPEANLHQGDMSDFNLDKKFDVILCVFDSINHLKDFTEWQSLFNKAAEHLEPNGLLLFDINTIGRLKWLIEQPVWFTKLDENYMAMDVQAGTDTLTNWNIKIFESIGDDTYKLYEENIAEASFEIKKIKRGLAGNFDVIELASNNGAEPNDEANRVYFICQ